ncbi:hypothetical protein FB107DRAFT_291396 [Schizophyllum commune]
MFAKVAIFASAVLVGSAAAFNGRAFPEKTNGTVYECGFAVHNNDFAAFVSPARFNATHCGKEVQASSPYGVGETIYPKLAGIYKNCNGCGDNDIQVTPRAYKEATSHLAGQDWISVVWAYKTW